MTLSSCKDEKAVFIVGMPRSGTTLTEQVLAAHPDIFGSGELGHIRNIARNLHEELNVEKFFPLCAGEITRNKANELSKQYVDFFNISSTKNKICN